MGMSRVMGNLLGGAPAPPPMRVWRDHPSIQRLFEELGKSPTVVDETELRDVNAMVAQLESRVYELELEVSCDRGSEAELSRVRSELATAQERARALAARVESAREESRTRQDARRRVFGRVLDEACRETAEEIASAARPAMERLVPLVDEVIRLAETLAAYERQAVQFHGVVEGVLVLGFRSYLKEPDRCFLPLDDDLYRALVRWRQRVNERAG
jgi:hypothetical protein